MLLSFMWGVVVLWCCGVVASQPERTSSEEGHVQVESREGGGARTSDEQPPARVHAWIVRDRGDDILVRDLVQDHVLECVVPEGGIGFRERPGNLDTDVPGAGVGVFAPDGSPLSSASGDEDVL